MQKTPDIIGVMHNARRIVKLGAWQSALAASSADNDIYAIAESLLIAVEALEWISKGQPQGGNITFKDAYSIQRWSDDALKKIHSLKVQ